MVQRKAESAKTEPETLPTDPEAVAYQRFDAEDDQQILAEIQGRNLEILDRMVYSFTDRRGNAVTGLSLTGVRETVREMNRRGLARIKITSELPIIRETNEYIDVIVYAEDELNGGGSWGTKRQSKQTGNYANPFALEQALSKAQRNAMFALIPAAYVVEMIREYTEQGRAHELKSGPRQIAEPLPAARPGLPAGNRREEPAPATDAPDAPAPTAFRGDPVTEPQLKLIRSLLDRANLEEAELLQKMGVQALGELTKQRASQIIDRLLQRVERTKESA